ncbi:hypothetical protein GW17_00044086 [Ensete ventricosum]|nr:hypothetical protein GW17_00044086 [Ensete ventricosum]RZR79045.1 hypothetical protein BHM03_00004632 [Ensete ventricosum]
MRFGFARARKLARVDREVVGSSGDVNEVRSGVQLGSAEDSYTKASPGCLIINFCSKIYFTNFLSLFFGTVFPLSSWEGIPVQLCVIILTRQTPYTGGRTREDPKVQRRKIRLGKVTLWLFKIFILLNKICGEELTGYLDIFCRGRIADGTDLEFYIDTRPNGSDGDDS